MNQEITATYAWTVDELIKARENHGRAQCRPVYRAGLIFLSLMAVLAGWGYYLAHGWSVLTFLFPLAGVYFLFLRKYNVRWAIRRHFRKRPDRNAQVVWTIDENALQISTGESESKQNWTQISKVRRARNGLLLYPNDMIFYWLPISAFQSDDDRARAETLLRSKVKDFADIR